MKNLLTFIFVLILTLCTNTLFAQGSANTNVNVSVTVNASISISATNAVDFGTVVTGATASIDETVEATGSGTVVIAGSSYDGSSYVLSCDGATLSNGSGTTFAFTADYHITDNASTPIDVNGTCNSTNSSQFSAGGGTDVTVFFGGSITAPATPGTYNTTNTGGDPIGVTVQFL